MKWSFAWKCDGSAVHFWENNFRVESVLSVQLDTEIVFPEME